MRAMSAAPTMPRERSDSTTCKVSTSASDISAGLSTRAAPTSAARSAVRLGLQATTRMPKAAPTRATRAPRLPSPSTPSVLPSSPTPSATCQRPSRSARSCSGMRRSEGEDQPPGEVHRRVAGARRPAHRDAPLRAGGDVHRAVARGRGHQQAEVRQALDQGAREGRALAHDDQRIEGAEPVRQRVRVGEGVAEDLDPESVRQPVPRPEGARHALVVVEDGEAAQLRHGWRLLQGCAGAAAVGISKRCAASRNAAGRGTARSCRARSTYTWTKWPSAQARSSSLRNRPIS